MAVLHIAPLRAALAAGALLVALPAGAVSVDFDDRLGKAGPFSGPCGALHEVDDEYASLGVVFASNDAAVCVIAPGNPVSPPNVITGLSGGDIDFLAPVEVSFFDGATPRAVSVVILHLTSTSASSATVEAFDQNGASLGADVATGPGKHAVSFPRLIHRVRVSNGAISVDDLSFSPPGPPQVIPALPLVGGLVLFALTAGAGTLALRRLPD